MTTQELIQQLTDNTRNGDLNIDQINDLTYALRQALRQSQRANRSPESYAAAAEKGKATRAQNDMDRAMAVNMAKERQKKDDAAVQARKDSGLLPLRVDDYSGKPNPKYYTFAYDDQRSGIGYYDLKDEYKDEVIGIDDMYLQEMDELILNRWAKLANITEDDQPMTNKEISLALKDKTITEPSQEQLKQLFNAGYYIDQDQTATFPYILRGYKDENIMMHVKRVGGESGKVSYGYQIHSK
jgi:hypothetical protein